MLAGRPILIVPLNITRPCAASVRERLDPPVSGGHIGAAKRAVRHRCPDRRVKAPIHEEAAVS